MWKWFSLFLLSCITAVYILTHQDFVSSPLSLQVSKGNSTAFLHNQIIFSQKPYLFLGGYTEFFFRASAWFYQKKYRYIQPGTYKIPAHSSILNVLNHLVTERPLYRLTIPEGWTVQQILERIKNTAHLFQKEIKGIPEEGSLYPDTYHYSDITSSYALIVKMQNLMRYHIQNLTTRYTIPKPLKDSREVVILASIVERETPKIRERPRVAAVYLNRLKKGMRLQADPTVSYGLSKTVLRRLLTRKDLQHDTPFNTYTRKGLPPSPICCPSKSSLEAVLNPYTTDDLFFVADGTGGHVFSTSFKDHKINVRHWRKLNK